jgi:hypothetical protein
LFSFFAFVNPHSCARARGRIPNVPASLDGSRIKLIYSVYRRRSLDFSCDVARAPSIYRLVGKKAHPEFTRAKRTRNTSGRQVGEVAGDSGGLRVKLRVFAGAADVKSCMKHGSLYLEEEKEFIKGG